MLMIYAFRPIAICVLVLALGSLWGVTAAAERFVGGMEDVPLMTGLTEITEGRVEIDSPAGRIVQASATGAASKAEVLAFYTETLPKLGWRPQGAGVFLRAGKTLAVELEESISPGITVRFALFPKAEANIP